MVNKLKIPLRIVKWIAVALVIISFMTSMSSKFFQMIHLRKIGFNMISISPISVGLGLFGSIVALLLVFIDRVVYKHKIRTSPFQLLALLGGGVGLIYNLALLILLLS